MTDVRVGPLQVPNNLSEIAANGPDAVSEALGNLGAASTAAVTNEIAARVAGDQTNADAAAAALASGNAAQVTAGNAQTAAGTAQSTANSAAATAAAALPLAGGTMSGTLVLAGDPVGSLDAATRQWTIGYSAQLSLVGQPNGYATLDGSGKLPVAQLPAGSATTFKGTWNASTNTPTLSDGAGTDGDLYQVSVAGSTTLGGVSSWTPPDQVLRASGVWKKITAFFLGAASATSYTAAAFVSSPEYDFPSGSAILSVSGANFLAITDKWGFAGATWNADGTWTFATGLTNTPQTFTNVAATGNVVAGGFVSAVGPVTGSNFTTTSGDQVATVPAITGMSIAICDKWGFVTARQNTDATWTFNAGLSNTPITLPASVGLGSDLTLASVSVPGYTFAVTDKWGFTNFTVQAVPTSSPSPSLTYSAAEIAQRTTDSRFYTEKVRGTPNATGARAWWQYSHVIYYGQSNSTGSAGAPKLTLTQPLDVLMVGLSARAQDSLNTVFAPVGDGNYHPLVATTQASDGSDQPVYAGKALKAVQGCTIDSGKVLTTTDPAVDFTTFFSVGVVFVMQGWPGTLNNAPLDATLHGLGWWTVNAVSAKQLTLAFSNATFDVFASPINGISFFWIDPRLGEETGNQMMTSWRQYQLNLRSLLLDSTRLMLMSSTGRGGTTIAQLSKGAVPEYFNRIRGAVSAGSARAVTLGGSYGVPLVVFDQGAGDAGANTTYEVYKAEFLQLYADIQTDIINGLIPSQTKMPIFAFGQCSSGDMADVWNMAVCRAQMDVGVDPAYPNMYCLGPYYLVPGTGLHLDCNGYRWLGEKYALLLHDIMDRELGWEPLRPLRITNRGLEILVDFHVPVAPLVFRPIYYHYQAQTFSDYGFRVTDTGANGGILVIQSVQIVSDTCVRIIIDRNLAGNPYLWYGDRVVHGGAGNLFDSEPRVGRTNYVYVEGDGQTPVANIPELVGKPYPLWNGCCCFSIPIVQG